MKTQPVPEGFSTITPYLAVPGVAGLIEFLKKAFDAREKSRHELPNGAVVNAELRIGDSMIMLGEIPQGQKAWPAMLYLYVPDADAVFARAVKAGGKVVHEMTDQFYGDRSGALEDAAGNQWWVASRRENLSPEELKRRMEQLKR